MLRCKKRDSLKSPKFLNNMEITKLNLKQSVEALERGELTSLELTKAYLDRIEKLDSHINSYLLVTKDLALKQAEESDKRRKEGKILSKIDGIPMAVKDLYLTKGVKTTAASKILEDFVPVYESTVTQKLFDAGCVMLGKTNLDEFAMGSSTENSAYKTTKNPWDLSRVPGGSSGGSAAAVSADLCCFALGTDTGGSIRQPASLCSITGLKPTYGRVSRYGIIAMASSLDQAGPMTKTVEDAAIVMEVISGQDENDLTTSSREVPKYSKDLEKIDIKNLTVGIPEEFFGEGMDKGVEKVVKDAIEKMKSLGAKIVNVSLPKIKYALAIYYIIMPAEVSSNLARYDGIRFGYSILKDNQAIDSLEEVYKKSRAQAFGSEPKRRSMLGSYVLSSGYYDAYYKKAQQARVAVKNDFDSAFEKCDLLITPVSPTTAFKIGEKTDDPMTMYLSDVHTVPINPAGLPAMSIPAGFVNGLPVGMQIIGNMWDEEKILKLGNIYQQNTDYHLQKPKILDE